MTAKWTPDEDAVLRSHAGRGVAAWRDYVSALGAAGFRRTCYAVEVRMRALGLAKPRDVVASWTDAHDEIIRDGRRRRLSYEVIAQMVSAAGRLGTNKNMVVGRVNRLGLAGPGRARCKPGGVTAATDAGRASIVRIALPPPKRGPQPQARPAPLRAGVTGAARVEPPPVPGGMLFLAAAGRRVCKWPLAGAGLTLTVCGAPPAEGRPYCPACCRLAYQPLPARGERPPRGGGEGEAAPFARESVPDLVDVFAAGEAA